MTKQNILTLTTNIFYFIQKAGREMEEKKQAVIQSLQTGFGLIEMIAKERRPMKFTEIQQLSNMTKSKMYKYLTTLTQTGFLYRDSITNMYRLGNKLIKLGNIAQGDTSIIEIA